MGPRAGSLNLHRTDCYRTDQRGAKAGLCVPYRGHSARRGRREESVTDSRCQKMSGYYVQSDSDEVMMEPGSRGTVMEYCRATPGTPALCLGSGTHGMQGVQAEGGWRSCGGWQAHLHGLRVCDESRPGAGEEGSGLKSSQELVDGARVRITSCLILKPSTFSQVLAG